MNPQVNYTFVMCWQTHCKEGMCCSMLSYNQEFLSRVYRSFSFQAFHIKEFDMLQIFLGIYLGLSLFANLLLWTALAASRLHDMEEGCGS